MAAGVRLIYEPMSLVTGGVSGFAIVISHTTTGLMRGGVPVWITTGLFNIPLFIFGWHIKGKRYMLRSLFATIIFTVELWLIPNASAVGNDYVMAAVCGGVLTGAGLGLVAVTGSSTGGTDLLGAIIRYYVPECSIATLIMYIDTAIVIAGAIVFGISNALYAVIAVYVTSKVMDRVISGPRYSKLVMIITEEGEMLSKNILDNVDRGVTSIDVTGMYSRTKKNMLVCAASKREAIKIIRIVKEYAPASFVMISDIKEILGEGFVKVDEYLN